MHTTTPLQGITMLPDKRFWRTTHNVAAIPAGAKSVFIYAFPYKLPESAYPERNMARYACVPDYHATVLSYLNKISETLRTAHPLEAFVCFCDNSPLPEVEMAVRAGLGVRGKHNLLITPEFGSWVVLGEIVTTLPLETTQQRIANPACGDCSLCRNACPCGALLHKDGFMREKCISHITQQKQPLSPGSAEVLRQTGLVWGCDLCQEACPRNLRAATEPFAPFAQDTHPKLDTDTIKLPNRAYSWRGEAILRRNLDILNSVALLKK
jgi:epoxyqueuosine reductase